MHTNDLLLLLSKLSLKEIKSFNAYLRKQFKEDSIPLRLFQFLRKHHPDFSSTKVNYEKAFAVLGSKQPFNKIMVLNNLSDIRIALRKYLVGQHLQKTPFQQDMILLQVYQENQLDKHFEKQHKDSSNALENTTQKDIWYWLKKMQLDHEKYFYVNTLRAKNRDLLYSAMHNLDHFYAAAKLRYSCELYNGYQVMNQQEPNIQFLQEIESSNLWQNSEYHQFYLLALNMMRSRDESVFEQLKNEFFQNLNRVSEKDQLIILSYLMNHVSYLIRTDKQADLWSDYFDLVKLGYEKEIFTIDGILIPEHFLNTIELAGHLKEVEWAKSTIAKWGEKLEASNRSYYISLSKAILYFHIQDFESCSKTLAQIDVKEPQDKLRGRWLGIIADYEQQKDIDDILNRCDAFEKFIQRNRLIHTTRKKAVLLSIKIIKMFLKINPNKEKILDLLENSDNFHYKNWMKQKAKTL